MSRKENPQYTKHKHPLRNIRSLRLLRLRKPYDRDADRIAQKNRQIRETNRDIVLSGSALAVDALVVLGSIYATSELNLPPNAAICAITQGIITIPGISYSLARSLSKKDKIKRQY
jgi:hypothetical protein